MDLSKYLFCEWNSVTERIGTNFTCKMNENLEIVPAEFEVEDDDYIDTRIQKIELLENGIYQIDLSISNPEEEITQYHTYKIKVGDNIEIKQYVFEGYEGFYTLLVKITDITDKSFSYKIAGILEEEAEEEDYEYAPWEVNVDEELWILPREAIYSTQIYLKGISAKGDDYEISVFVKAQDDGDEDQNFTFTVRKGMILEWDELVPSVVCFVGPRRETAKFEVMEIDGEKIMIRKCYAK